jgi:hypothetical protein
VRNPGGVQKGVKETRLNGIQVVGPIAPQAAGSVNDVAVEMG